MNRGFLELVRTVSYGWKIGVSLQDKIRIAMLLTKHTLVNRHLASFSEKKQMPIKCSYKGVSFNLHARDNGTDAIIFYDIFINKCYDIKKCCELNKNFLPIVIYDIGANIGISALYFSSIFPSSQIIGFEPMPKNYSIAQLNYNQIENSKLFALAVGKENKTSHLILDEMRSGSHHLAEYDNDIASSDRKKISVEIVRLDTLIEKGIIPPPDLLKIDTEGAEYDILVGLGSFARSVQCVLLETHREDLHQVCKNWLLNQNFDIVQEKSYRADSMGYLAACRR